MRFIVAFIFLFLLTSLSFVSAQDHESLELHESSKPHLRLAALLGHAVVPMNEEGSRTSIPTWGFDLELWFNHKLGIGLHNELEMMTFVIERGENEEDLVREYPKILTIDVLYKPIYNLVLFGGVGEEFEVNEDFFLYRIGVEYEIPISDKWDMCPSFSYDSRKDAFNTCSIMLGVGYKFLH